MATARQQRSTDELRSAWSELVRSIGELERVLERPSSPTDSVDRAAGYRYIARQARMAIEDFVEHDDPMFPSFQVYSGPTRKVGVDNPDTDYLRAIITADHEYVVRVRPGTARYVSFDLYRGYFGQSDVRVGIVAHRRLEDFEPDASGEIVVELGGSPRAGNWLPLADGVDRLEIHQTFGDRAIETAGTFEILCTTANTDRPAIDEFRLARAFARAKDNLDNGSVLWSELTEEWMRHTDRLVRLQPSLVEGLQGNLDTAYYAGYWDLDACDRIVVSVTPPPCRYWSVQIANHWLESLDYRYGPSNVNSARATADEDGIVRIAIGPTPGLHHNWIDTTDIRRGAMVARFLGTGGDAVVETLCERDEVQVARPAGGTTGTRSRG